MITVSSSQCVYRLENLGYEHGFTTISSGSNSSWQEQSSFFEKENGSLFSQTTYFTPQQIHSGRVKLVTVDGSKKKYHYIPSADCLVYQYSPDSLPVCLFVRTSDCLPILFCSKKERLIAVAHLGWQGARSNLLENLNKLLTKLKINRQNLKVLFGPAINGACYNIPMKRSLEFSQYSNSRDFIFKNQGQIFFSLLQFAVTQLAAMGFNKSLFSWRLFCTHCQTDNFFSYRRGSRNQSIISYLYCHG
jgi:YfiH family protein